MKTKLLLLLLAICEITNAQTAVDTYLQNYMTTNHIPGMSACIVKNGKLAWAKGYGIADIPLNKSVTVNTIFMLASVSKTITADALMNEWECGAFQLTDAINLDLPWNVHNPNYPSTPITYAQILTHTASVQDNWSVLDGALVNGDSPYALGTFMHDYLVVGASNYDANQNFYQYAPGTSYNYCNASSALCGYMVERLAASTTSFNQYCIDSIFTPLCMTNTSWLLSEIADSTMIARPYLYSGGNYSDAYLYGFPDYPDGQLRTTVVSLAKFLLMNMQYGRFGNIRVLDSTTVDLMRTVQFPSIDPTQGLIWYKSLLGSRQIWGHSGGYNGYTSEMWMDPQQNEGVIILTNLDGVTTDPMLTKIFQLADTISLIGKPDLTCNISTEINENILPETELTIYPNPFSSSASINSTAFLNSAELTIFNIYGQKVKTVSNLSGTTIKIERENLNSGIYFYELKQGIKNIATGKLIVAD